MARNGNDKLIEKLEGCFSEKNIKKYLDKTNADYRYLEPGRFLYKMTMKFNYKEKFGDDFLELAYITLKAWGMNSQSATLVKYPDFKSKIRKVKKHFDKLKNERIEDFEKNNYSEELGNIFLNLKLSETQSQLVTVSKLMHFILPHLIVPIDRKYTLNFFNKNNQNTFADIDKQFSVFINIEKAYSMFLKENELKKYKDRDWNQNIPKILDNLVIGYMLKQKESKEA